MATRHSERPWGTGSIEARGSRWMARHRDSDGRQRGRTFSTPEEAGAYLDEVNPGRGNRPVPIAQLRALVAHWRQTAAFTLQSPGEDTSALIRETSASELKACATELENLYDCSLPQK